MKLIYYYKTKFKEIKNVRIKSKFNLKILVGNLENIGVIGAYFNLFNISLNIFLKEVNLVVNQIFENDVPINLKMIIFENGKYTFSIKGFSFYFVFKLIYLFKLTKIINILNNN